MVKDARLDFSKRNNVGIQAALQLTDRKLITEERQGIAFDRSAHPVTHKPWKKSRQNTVNLIGQRFDALINHCASLDLLKLFAKFANRFYGGHVGWTNNGLLRHTPCWKTKQYNLSLLGNEIYCNAKIFHCCLPTWRYVTGVNRSQWGNFCYRPPTWQQWRSMKTIYDGLLCMFFKKYNVTP